MAAYNEAIRLEPANAYHLYGRGTTSGWMGMYDEAIDDLRQAIRLKPDFEEACVGLSHTCAWKAYYLGRR